MESSPSVMSSPCREFSAFEFIHDLSDKNGLIFTVGEFGDMSDS